MAQDLGRQLTEKCRVLDNAVGMVLIHGNRPARCHDEAR